MPTHSRWHQPPPYTFTLVWDTAVTGGLTPGNLSGSLPAAASAGPTVDGFTTTWHFGISQYAEVGIGRTQVYDTPLAPTTADFTADIAEFDTGPGQSIPEAFLARMVSTTTNNSGSGEWQWASWQGGLLLRLFPPYPEPDIASWPAGALGVEYEDAIGGNAFENVAAKMSGVSAQLDYSASLIGATPDPGSVTVFKIPPSEHAAYAAFGGPEWHRPAAVIEAWPPVGTIPVTASVTGTISASVASTDWSDTRLGVFTLTGAEGADTPPSFPVMPGTFGDHVDNGYSLRATKLTLSGTFRPPQFRFLFNTRPRLRQFPRDDSLGGSPRQGKANGPTSVQGSTRQGWRGTYR